MLFNTNTTSAINIATVSKQWIDYAPRWARVTFRQMMYYGVHLGHSVLNSNPYCGWLAAGLRQGLFLIDLFKFSYQLRVGLFAVEAAVRRRSPVWFIHPQPASPVLISECAVRCGEYYFHYPWLGGLLTNHRILRRSIRLMALRQDAGRKAKERRYWEANFRQARWRFARSTWPRTIFVSSARLGIKPCHEAQCLGISSLVITDTNTSASLASIAIPANDESTTALWFYTNLISLFILHRKFSFLNRFLWKVRKRWVHQQQLTVDAAATLFATKDLWRRHTIRALTFPHRDHHLSTNSSASLSATPGLLPLPIHPWSRTLAYLIPWKGPWNSCHKRTRKWFARAMAAKTTPPYNRGSPLRPKVQRIISGTFGRERGFQKLTPWRGSYRSRPLWIFYQTFSTFFLAFSTRWLTLFRRPLRRLFRRPRGTKKPKPRLPFLQRLRKRLAALTAKPRKRSRRRHYFRRHRRPQRLRHPWADFSAHLNIEGRVYPDPLKPKRWQPLRSVINTPRVSLQLSRYTARQVFARWFIHQR